MTSRYPFLFHKSTHKNTFPCFQNLLAPLRGLEEFSKVMQTLDFVSGCKSLKNSPNPPCVQMRLMQLGNQRDNVRPGEQWQKSPKSARKSPNQQPTEAALSARILECFGCISKIHPFPWVMGSGHKTFKYSKEDIQRFLKLTGSLPKVFRSLQKISEVYPKTSKDFLSRPEEIRRFRSLPENLRKCP